MPVEPSSWVLPVAKEAYDHREEILSAWGRLTALLLGKKKSIAFTGMSGIGKTVLYDHLSGKAFKQGYSPPLTSQALETGKLSKPKKRIHISVIPGQDAPPRQDAIEKIFSGKNAVDGVIYVVANGFAEVRSQQAKEVLINTTKLSTIDQYRDFHLGQELKSLDSTCELIRQSIHRHQKPSWMLVAVAKIDLYYESIKQAEAYYSPYGNSRFVDRIKQLQSQVGTDAFSWDTVPVCTWLEDFKWNTETCYSTLKPYQRDYFLSAFAKHLEQYCE